MAQPGQARSGQAQSGQVAPRHVTVVGAGVDGMATALTLRLDGHAVTVIDRLPPGEATSFGNAGGIAVTAVTPAAMPGILRKVPG